jgi:hypothetical protein
MCEPYHSVVQLPEKPPDDSDIDVGGTLSGGSGGGIAAKLGSMLKKIGSWFHLSRMGSGHSESFESSGLASQKLPPTLQYEINWVERSMTRDPLNDRSRVYLHQMLLNDAHEAAQIYADRVSVGSLPALRRFLEASVKASDRSWLYFDEFSRLLLPKHRDTYIKKIQELGGKLSRYGATDPATHPSITKLMLGYTRKRHLLIPEWADDDRLWVPS